MKHLLIFTIALVAVTLAIPYVIGHRLYVLCRRRKPCVVRCTDGTYLILGEVVK